ncbi:MAG: hypothetical protein NW237_08100 [Cyanobacteriota bacterium]|nr:hypothetical protein [Cyanobacteriota bacterium]
MYELYPDANQFRGFTVVKTENLSLESCFFRGTPLLNSWHSLHIEPVEQHVIESRKLSDFPAFFSMICPVFSKASVDVLQDILLENGEVLPLISSIGNYFAYNITCIADVLDAESSIIRNKNIEKHVFHSNKIRSLKIFKIPQTILVRAYVTDEFVDRVSVAKLTGFKFRFLWADS